MAGFAAGRADRTLMHSSDSGHSRCAQAYVKSCMKFRGYGFTFYVAKVGCTCATRSPAYCCPRCKTGRACPQQTHLKGEPKTVFVGVNVDGVSIFKTSDKVRPPQALVVARSLLTSWIAVAT